MKDLSINRTNIPGVGLVLKSHPVVNAIGDINELNCHINLTFQSQLPNSIYLNNLFYIKEDLILIKEQLSQSATDKRKVEWKMIANLKDAIIEMEKITCNKFENDTPTWPAQIYLTRAVCQRAERSVIAWIQHEDKNDTYRYLYDTEEHQDNRFTYVTPYLDALGNYLLQLARYVKVTGCNY